MDPDSKSEPLICLRCDGTGKTHGIGGGVTRCPCCGGRGVEYVERKPQLIGAEVNVNAGDGV